MSLKKRLTAVGVIAVAAALTFGVAKSGRQITEKRENTVFNNGKETIYLWYTDEALSSYLSSAAVAYSETHDVRVMPVLEGGPEYLENINRASLEAEAPPDLYILGHDSLEKAYLRMKWSLPETFRLKSFIWIQGFRRQSMRIS